MIIDERIVQDGVDAIILSKLIHQHGQHIEGLEKQFRYYKGDHEICHRPHKTDPEAANNKIMCNHAKYIVDIAKAYLVGNPIKYEASEGFDIEPIKNVYLEQNIAHIDGELVKLAGIYGRVYELVYADEKSRPRSVYIHPTQAFVVYNDDCTHYPLFGVYYYKTRDIDGNVNGVVCNVYYPDHTETWESNVDSWESMNCTYDDKHYFGDVPLIEYRNNEERQGDYEQIISQIDAYNILQSDRVNDKQDFVNSFLFVREMLLDDDTAKALKKERILCGEKDSDAKFLDKLMTESDIKTLRDDLKEDIHRFSMVPDLSDDSFGNNLSGVAIKYKLLGFEQMTKNKEETFTRSLKKRFELYNSYLNKRDNMPIVPTHRVDVVFTHNLPVNNLEVSQMLSYLGNDVSLETKLSQLDFVSDPKEEAKLVRDQAAAEYEEKIRRVEGIAKGGGYGTDFNQY
ncbi:MAG: phage portal protein [Candidatus Ornithomonoglobus sp.]